MLISGTGKAIAVIIGAFIVMLILFGKVLLSAALSNGGMASAPSTSFNLTYDDIYGNARLTQSERGAAVDLCITKAVNAPISGGATSINLRGSISTLRKKRAEEIGPMCDCVVNQIEDRSSKMQFLMVMDAVAQTNTLFGRRNPPNFRRYWEQAQKLGMSKNGFHETTRQMDLILSSTFKTCVRHLSGQ